MVKKVKHVNCDMQVMCEDRLPMYLNNMREGYRVFVGLGSCRMEVGDWPRKVGSIGDMGWSGIEKGDVKGEADTWSTECLVKRLKPVMLLRRKLTRWNTKKVVNIFVILKH